jgi:hypothetical protein
MHKWHKRRNKMLLQNINSLTHGTTSNGGGGCSVGHFCHVRKRMKNYTCRRIFILKDYKLLTYLLTYSVALVRKQTIPTERPEGLQQTDICLLFILITIFLSLLVVIMKLLATGVSFKNRNEFSCRPSARHYCHLICGTTYYKTPRPRRKMDKKSDLFV